MGHPWKKVSLLVMGLALLALPSLGFAAACNDGLDNDGDGWTDFPADLECASPAGTSELFAPSLVGNFPTSSNALDVFVSGNYAYVAADYSGLRIINVLNPASPTETGFYDTPGEARGIQVLGNTAYVADMGSGFESLNVANPAAPTLIGSYDTPGNSIAVFASGDHAFLADRAYGLQILNLSNPASPLLQGTYNTPDTSYDVSISGNYAYVADGHSGLLVFDVSNPSAPALTGSYNTPGISYGVFLSGTYAYVADGAFGLQIFNVSNPAAPTLIGSYNFPGSCDGVYVQGNYAFVANEVYGLQIILISNPEAPVLVGSYNTPGISYGVHVSGNYAYVADGGSGLQIFDIACVTDIACINDADRDGLPNDWERSYSCLNPRVADSGADPDGDGLSNLEEYNGATDPCVSNCLDSDLDGYGTGCLLGPDCNDGDLTVYPAAPEICDGQDNQCPGDAGYGTVDEGCGPPDADGDGLPDSWENTYTCLQANTVDNLVDVEPDGLSNEQEYAEGTDPCDADTDNDGANDGEEANTYLTNPLSPDSDGDLIGDNFEIMWACLDPLVDDALGDFDGDGLENVHEFFNDGDGNLSDPCDIMKPKLGAAGGSYFGDADGDLVIGVPDMNAINLKLNGRSYNYSNAFPADPVIQDLDGDLVIGVPDKNLLSVLLNGRGADYVTGSPTELTLVEPASPPTKLVGETVRIKVKLTKEVTTARAGFGVVFTIVSGSGTLLGGEGVSGPGRYDLTALDGMAQMVVEVTGSETPIRVQVDLPYDGEVHTRAVTGPEVLIKVGP